jgi:hypothetical protein
MIVSMEALVEPAKRAGMRVPDLSKAEAFDEREYRHFAVFCWIQSCLPIGGHRERWWNARVIAKVPEESIMGMSLGKIVALGIRWRTDQDGQGAEPIIRPNQAKDQGHECDA